MKAKDLATAKAKVVHLFNDMTIDEALKVLLKSNLASIPVLERDSNRYLYSLSAFAILKKVANGRENPDVYKEPISSVSLERFIVPCTLDTEIDNLIDLVVSQNFVPLVDASGAFQGIVTRKAVINYMSDRLSESEE